MLILNSRGLRVMMDIVLFLKKINRNSREVIKFNNGRAPLNDIIGRLRLLADDIESGKYAHRDPIESCLVILSQNKNNWPIILGYGDVDGDRSPIITLQLALQMWINNTMTRGGK